MNRFYLVLFVLIPILCFTQTDQNRLPKSKEIGIALKSAFNKLPATNNLEEVRLHEKRSQTNREKIAYYGKPIPVSFSMYSDFEKTILFDSSIVYQLGIESKDAVSLNLLFNFFHLKQGTTLHILSANTNNYIGAYTSLNNNPTNVLGTELLYDSKIIVEVYEPKENVGSSRLEIGSVIHGFRDLETLIKRKLNSSGACNYDVNCPQGSGYENQRNSVALMINNAGGFCTGTLVNTTAGPFKPYFLSANHCGTSPGAWVFRFRWESPENGMDCGTSSPSADGIQTMSINGATLLATSKVTDFLLCELNTAPDSKWDIYYNGWDKSGKTPLSGTGIHHPYADIKKISLDKDSLVSEAFNPGEPANHWRTNWNIGVTEPASSGSPLFDENHRLIGQLHGGDSGCNSDFQTDFYGKLSESWEGEGTPSTRLKDWLDPINVNVNAIDGTLGKTYDPFIHYFASNLDTRYCSDSILPSLILTNGGVDDLTNCVISYSFDGGQKNTYTWTGKLAYYEWDTIYLPKQKFSNGTHSFTAFIENQGLNDANTKNNSINTTFNSIQNFATYKLELQLDTYGNETNWKIINGNQEIIYSEGPYSETSNPPRIEKNFCLTKDCYSFQINDYGNDGLYTSDSIRGYVNIYNDSNKIIGSILPQNAKFGATKTIDFCTTNGTADVTSNNTLKLFPNPCINDKLITVESETDTITNIILYTVSGQRLKEINSFSNAVQIPVSNITSGYYYLEIYTKKGILTEPFIKL